MTFCLKEEVSEKKCKCENREGKSQNNANWTLDENK
jgi:hypothetical protein